MLKKWKLIRGRNWVKIVYDYDPFLVYIKKFPRVAILIWYLGQNFWEKFRKIGNCFMFIVCILIEIIFFSQYPFESLNKILARQIYYEGVFRKFPVKNELYYSVRLNIKLKIFQHLDQGWLLRPFHRQLKIATITRDLTDTSRQGKKSEKPPEPPGPDAPGVNHPNFCRSSGVGEASELTQVETPGICHIVLWTLNM